MILLDQMFRDRLQISRQKLEFYYSIGILLIIPLLTVGNTLLMSSAVRKNFDSELRRKADMANTLIATGVKYELHDQQKLKAYITEAKTGNDLERVIIAEPLKQDTFKVLAADEDGEIGKELHEVQYVLAASRRQSIAQLVEKDGKRSWSVVSPIILGDTVAAVIATNVSLTHADNLIGNTLLRSLVFVGLTVAVIVLLLMNHFRFVEYALLFRKLKEVDQLKNDFLSVATHELRVPMAVIKGNIENLEEGLTGVVDEKGKAVLQTIAAETDRLTGLVNDLLNVSRLEQGRITYNMEKADAREIIEPLVAQFAPRAQDKGLTLSYEKPTEPVTVVVDKGRLTEIMTNLIDNAIKYSREGTVAVSHKSEPGKAKISIRDTGIGMSSSERERLFSRFYRVRNEKTKDVTGTGLGLWIVKQYIEAMKGTITVDSLEGVGTEFIIELPIAEVSKPLAPHDSEENAQITPEANQEQPPTSDPGSNE